MTTPTRAPQRRATGLLPSGAAALLALAGSALGQATPSRSLPTPEPLARALTQTQDSGRITVALSPRLAEALRVLSAQRGIELQSSVNLAPIIEVPAGDKSFGEIRVYRAGAGQPEMMARLDNAQSAAHALDWLQQLPAPDASADRDEEVVRTHGHDHAAPSPQAPYTAPPQTLAPAPQLMIQGAPQAAYVQAPAPQPIVVQTPAPSVVLQQTPPTIYVAQPSTPANIQILAAPAAAPSVSVIQPATYAAAAPTVVQPQLFLAQPAAAPVAAPAVAYAVPAAMPAPTLVAAPAAATATTVREVGPGLFGRMIGGVGESMLRMGDHLAKHKASRLITETHAVPAAAPAAYQYAAPAPVQYQTAVPQAAPPAQASPQAAHGIGHGFFHKR